MTLSIPQIDPDRGTMTAAFQYINAGWYVLPIKNGSKHPGSVVGFAWNDKSSRDPEMIVTWFMGTDHGIALHAGRSGAVIFDVDSPDAIPTVLGAAFADEAPPMQRTRDGDDRRGHYLFLQPVERTLGNGTGKLGGEWGEVRGLNGIIVVAPSVHENAANGGRYVWLQTGELPVLPDSVADLLHDASPSEDAASDSDIVAFLDEYTGDSEMHLLDGWVRNYKQAVARGESRHEKAVSMLAGALAEAATGRFPARDMAGALHGAFIESVAKPPTGKQGSERSGKKAEIEWTGILAWAVGQAKAADPAATERRLAEVHSIKDLPSLPPPPLGAGVPVSVGQAAAAPQPEPAAAPDDQPRSSWAPIDLEPYLDGTYEPEMPTLLPRTDDAHLLYPGRVHSFHGESESGKSMVAQAEAARLIKDGRDVLYIDYESDAAAVSNRLKEMGAPVNLILRHFTYIRPETSPYAAADHPRWTELIGRRFVLAVIDGVTDALGTFSASSKDNDEISAWMRQVPRVLATKTGAAVVLVDHVVKDADSRGRYAVGGQAKMNALDGAAYTVEITEHLGRGLKGVVTLRVAKDRPGSVRPIAGPYRKSDRTQEAARITIDSTSPPSIIVTVNPAAEPVKLAPGQPTADIVEAMVVASAHIKERPEGVKQNATVIGLGLNHDNVRKALVLLRDQGYTKFEGGLHRHVKPFLGWPSMPTLPSPSEPSETVRQPSETVVQEAAETVQTVRPYEVGRTVDGDSQQGLSLEQSKEQMTAFSVAELAGRRPRYADATYTTVIDRFGEVVWSP